MLININLPGQLRWQPLSCQSLQMPEMVGLIRSSSVTGLSKVIGYVCCKFNIISLNI